jgi:hypothetical protein
MYLCPPLPVITLHPIWFLVYFTSPHRSNENKDVSMPMCHLTRPKSRAGDNLLMGIDLLSQAWQALRKGVGLT